MSLWHRLKVRLGLEDDWDDEYDDDYYDEEFTDGTESSGDGFYGRKAYDSSNGSNASVKRTDRVDRVDRESDYDRSRNSHLRSVPSGGDVSQLAPQVKMHIVEPKSYTEAQNIADKFKMGTPVIMNMSMTQADLAKRMIDFASGLTYGLDGGLQKISDKVFMLTPANVDVSAGDVRRLKDNGLFGIDR